MATVLRLVLGVTLMSCGDTESGDDPVDGFVVTEQPGTGTTGGNPTTAVVVAIDEPALDGVLVQWQPPRLVFDRMEIWRLDATGTCVLDEVREQRRVDVRLTRAQQLQFLGARLCGVSLERVDGPVLLFDGTTVAGRPVELAFAEEGQLALTLTRVPSLQVVAGVLSVQLRSLLSGVEAAIGNAGDGALSLSDLDPERGATLRANLTESLVGYLDPNADRVLTPDERTDANVFLRVEVRR
jgi:hypothetical protein